VGGGSIDPKINIQLAAALKKAKDQGIPKENIEKAIAKVKQSFYSIQFNCLIPMYGRQVIQKRKGDRL
jgi:transcriptional/translational regulatory protein YebC/TACO1